MGDYLLLSRGESKDQGRARQVILANAMEAFIGAMYLDLGYEKTHNFIKEHILVQLPEIIKSGSFIDPKSQLQELVQERSGITPTYKVLSEEGPDHKKTFSMGVFVQDFEVGSGSGPSKQEAELTAAEAALKSEKWKKII